MDDDFNRGGVFKVSLVAYRRKLSLLGQMSGEWMGGDGVTG